MAFGGHVAAHAPHPLHKASFTTARFFTASFSLCSSIVIALYAQGSTHMAHPSHLLKSMNATVGSSSTLPLASGMAAFAAAPLPVAALAVMSLGL
jgi:hypothetical protein